MLLDDDDDDDGSEEIPEDERQDSSSGQDEMSAFFRTVGEELGAVETDEMKRRMTGARSVSGLGQQQTAHPTETGGPGAAGVGFEKSEAISAAGGSRHSAGKERQREESWAGVENDDVGRRRGRLFESLS